MSESKATHLRQQGIVVIPFMHSLNIDPQRAQPHYHDFFQMFLLQGKAEVMHDFQEFSAHGTTLVIMSPGQVHTAHPAPGMKGTTVSFTQDFFDGEAPPPSRLLEYPFFFPAEAKPWLAIPRDDPFRIAEVFADLQSEFDATLNGAAEVLRSLLHILLVRVNRQHEELHPAREVSRAVMLARQFHLAVEQRFRELSSVEQYAKLLGVTTNHLHDLIREQTGHAPGELIRRRRLLDAKRLLLHSDLSVSEIGYQLGFRDPSYFSRFFRREVELTPAEFREEIREKYQRKHP